MSAGRLCAASDRRTLFFSLPTNVCTILCCIFALPPVTMLPYGEVLCAWLYTDGASGEGPAMLWFDPLLLCTRPALPACAEWCPVADARRAGMTDQMDDTLSNWQVQWQTPCVV